MFFNSPSVTESQIRDLLFFLEAYGFLERYHQDQRISFHLFQRSYSLLNAVLQSLSLEAMLTERPLFSNSKVVTLVIKIHMYKSIYIKFFHCRL